MEKNHRDWDPYLFMEKKNSLYINIFQYKQFLNFLKNYSFIHGYILDTDYKTIELLSLEDPL